MLYCFGFETIAVVASDVYFFDGDAPSDQQGAERGVRLEVRKLELGEPVGSIFSAQPVRLGAPVWRADLFETVDGTIGSFDRTHHHPRFTGWEPQDRVFDPELSRRPLEFVGERLADVDGILETAGFGPSAPGEAEEIRRAVPEIVSAVGHMLERVRAGELGRPPAEAPVATTRLGWL